MKKLTNNKWYNLVIFFISCIAGFQLIFFPETVHRYILMGIGIVWLIEGVNHLSKFFLLYLEDNLAEEKRKSKILFITYDKVAIHEGDYYYKVSKNSFFIGCLHVAHRNDKPEEGFEYFVDEKIAKLYLHSIKC